MIKGKGMNINNTIYDSGIMHKVRTTGDTRSGHNLVREAIFMRMILLNVVFVDADHVSTLTGGSVSQCKLVWDALTEAGVLSQVEGGFTLNGWIKSCGYFDTKSKTATRSPRTRQNRAQDIETCNITGATTERCVSRLGDANDERQFVRQNVSFSKDEIKALRESFTDEQLTVMTDKLSEWKTQKAATGNPVKCSDFTLMNGWVARWISGQNSQAQNPVAKSVEQEFKDSHCGKTPKEWEEMESWENSEEGQKKISEFREKIKTIGFLNHA